MLSADIAPSAACARHSRQAHAAAVVMVLVALVLLLSGCAGLPDAARSSTTATSTGPEQDVSDASFSFALLTYVAPVDGGDLTNGFAIREFVAGVAAKSVAACLVSDGFPDIVPAPSAPGAYGNADFPNLPVIERTHRLWLLTRIPAVAQGGYRELLAMSPAESTAYQAAAKRCARTTPNWFPVLDGPEVESLQNRWYAIVHAVQASPQIMELNHAASHCLARYGVDASSLAALYAQFADREWRLVSKHESPAQLDQEAAKLVVACFAPAVSRSTQVLKARRNAFDAENALAIQQIQRSASRELATAEQKVGDRPR